MSVAQAADQPYLRLQVYVLRPRKVTAKDLRQPNATANEILNYPSVGTVMNRPESFRKPPLMEDGSADGLVDVYELVRKFVHLTHPLISIALLRDEIAERYRRIYDEPLEIMSVKDDSNCDFDMEYLASYVFTNGSVINVITPPAGGPDPSELQSAKDANVQDEYEQHDQPPLNNKASDGEPNWLSSAAAEMTETAKRSLKSLSSDESSDEDNPNRINTSPDLRIPSYERSPSLTPDDSSSHFQPESSARPSKKRRRTRKRSLEIAESVIEESQAAYVPTQVDEFNKYDDMPMDGDDSFTAADDFGPRLGDRRRSFLLPDVQLNPRLSLPPVLSSDADIDVDPQKHPSSGHATASSSPVRSLFDIPVNNDNASTTSVPEIMPNHDMKTAPEEEEVPANKKTETTTEVGVEEETGIEVPSTKETTPPPATDGGTEVVTPTGETGSKIIHQLKDANGELAKLESKKGWKKSPESGAKNAPARPAAKTAPTKQPRKRNVPKTAAGNVDGEAATEEIATALTEATPDAVESAVFSTAPEQPVSEKATATDSAPAREVPNEGDETNAPAVVHLAEEETSKATTVAMFPHSFDEEVLKRVRQKIAQEKAQPRPPATSVGEATVPVRRGRKPGTKNKPKVLPDEAKDHAVAEKQTPKMSPKKAVPLPPAVQEGFSGRGIEATANVAKKRITRLGVPRTIQL
ncbi:hypothetical protein V1520DRAFT_359351 [Lipomyces starkeyi]|uniref:Nucleolar protein Dnt1-like N-terminal domain-containing protein n=1 Tax=Lipomyces starkeyi NRRL Y-11557 TaxID=675824 RepID=A0A1E3PWV4_LIPST|nr:hypothetical protein LIPSTDRAFT_75396 [Lipomyces starkeyi NRRL Y-11557]